MSPWKDGVAGTVEQVDLAALPLRSARASSEIDILPVLLVLVRVGDRGAGLDRPEAVDLRPSGRASPPRATSCPSPGGRRRRRCGSCRARLQPSVRVPPRLWVPRNANPHGREPTAPPSAPFRSEVRRRGAPWRGAEPEVCGRPRPHAVDDHEGESMSEERRLPLTGCRGGQRSHPRHGRARHFRALSPIGAARQGRAGRHLARPRPASRPRRRDQGPPPPGSPTIPSSVSGSSARRRRWRGSSTRTSCASTTSSEDRGQTVLVMELVEGEARHRLVGGPRTWSEARGSSTPRRGGARARARARRRPSRPHARERPRRARQRPPRRHRLRPRAARTLVAQRARPSRACSRGRARVLGARAGVRRGHRPRDRSLRPRLHPLPDAERPPALEGEDRGSRPASAAPSEPPRSTAAPGRRRGRRARRPLAGARPRPPRHRDRGGAVARRFAGDAPGQPDDVATVIAPPRAAETLVTRVLREPATVVRRPRRPLRASRPRTPDRIGAALIAVTAVIALAGGGVYAVASQDPPGIDAPDVVGLGVTAAREEVRSRTRQRRAGAQGQGRRPLVLRVRPGRRDRRSRTRPTEAESARAASCSSPSAGGAPMRTCRRSRDSRAPRPSRCSSTQRLHPDAPLRAVDETSVARRRDRPTGGTNLKRPARVALVVSTGPPKRPVPSLEQMSVGDASQSTSRRGLHARRRGACRHRRRRGHRPRHPASAGREGAHRLERDDRGRARAALGADLVDRQHRGRHAAADRRPGGRPPRADDDRHLTARSVGRPRRRPARRRR